MNAPALYAGALPWPQPPPLDWREIWRKAMLDARKTARILANRARIRQGRTTTVAIVTRGAGGAQSAEAVDVVLKQVNSSEPASVDQQGLVVNEYQMDLDLNHDPAAIAFVALTGGALDQASIAAAPALEVLMYRMAGLVGDRWLVTLRRFR